VQPLAAAAARRRGDRYRLEIAGPAAGGDGRDDRALLGADTERVGRVLDVDSLEDASVAGQDRGADEVAGIRRVGARGYLGRPLVKLGIAQGATWKRTSVSSAPSVPP
jgi:hypothetical protein